MKRWMGITVTLVFFFASVFAVFSWIRTPPVIAKGCFDRIEIGMKRTEVDQKIRADLIRTSAPNDENRSIAHYVAYRWDGEYDLGSAVFDERQRVTEVRWSGSRVRRASIFEMNCFLHSGPQPIPGR